MTLASTRHSGTVTDVNNTTNVPITTTNDTSPIVLLVNALNPCYFSSRTVKAGSTMPKTRAYTREELQGLRRADLQRLCKVIDTLIT